MPPEPPAPSPSSPAETTARLIGIEIGGTKLQIAAGDSNGTILERLRFHINRPAGAEGIREQLVRALPPLAEKWRSEAIGVGYGGPVNWKSGRIARSYHIEGWSDFPLGEWLSQCSGLPAFVENDANAAALGEALYGAGRKASPVLWMNAGSGVGGGLVVNGQIYHGAPPGEIELGHLRLTREGAITEDFASGWSVDKMVREAAENKPQGALANAVRALASPGGEARALAPALDEHDPDAKHILDNVGNSLAYALSHAVHLLHPETIVFGGGLALIGEPLRSRIESALSQWLMDAFLPGPDIRIAALMEDAVLVGGLAVAAARLRVASKSA
jgi:glucokinase